MQNSIAPGRCFIVFFFIIVHCAELLVLCSVVQFYLTKNDVAYFVTQTFRMPCVYDLHLHTSHFHIILQHNYSVTRMVVDQKFPFSMFEIEWFVFLCAGDRG